MIKYPYCQPLRALTSLTAPYQPPLGPFPTLHMGPGAPFQPSLGSGWCPNVVLAYHHLRESACWPWLSRPALLPQIVILGCCAMLESGDIRKRRAVYHTFFFFPSPFITPIPSKIWESIFICSLVWPVYWQTIAIPLWKTVVVVRTRLHKAISNMQSRKWLK